MAGAPRLIIAGSAGDSGKTTVSLGLLAAWRGRGLAPVAFKKGPDFIDAAWLGWAAGASGRNLDTFLMPEEALLRSFWRHAAGADVALVEGNRGLLDGMDERGTHSTAALAALLSAPVILVLPVTKVTRTAAALVLGIRTLTPDLRLAGVVLNRVAGARHESVCRRSIETLSGVPVLGALPRLEESPLSDRHLGLVPPAETEDLDARRVRLMDLAERHLNLDAILEAARAAGPAAATAAAAATRSAATVRIGVVRDRAFTFYYPENLEALEAEGAELVFVSSLSDRGLPELDALYIGGGFPETHAEAIASNRPFLGDLARAAERGLPIYAECGGLMLLCRSLAWKGRRHPMAGVFPLSIEVGDRPAASHGYMRVRVDRENPFHPVGTELAGHEFHYSRIVEAAPDLATAFAVARGGGCFSGRDGLLHGNVLASYLHVHALGAPSWARGMVRAAREYRQRMEMGTGADRQMVLELTH